MSILDNQWYLINLIFTYYYEFNYVDFKFFIILPELLLILFCCLILVFNYNFNVSFLHKYTCFFLIFLFFFYLLFFFINFSSSIGFFDFFFMNFWIVDLYFIVFKALIVFLTLITLILSKNILFVIEKNFLNEFFLLILFAIFFSLTLLSSNDFFISYISLEGMSFSLYILASTIYYSKLSVESAIKYFILGGVASCILCYSISLLFLVTSSLDFFSVRFFFSYIPEINGRLDLILIIAGFVFSFLFKLSAFPCHMWAPDVYEGIWTPVTAFFAIVIKTTVFIFVLRVFCYVLSPLVNLWQPLFLVSSIGSIIIGCLGALTQKKIKRFLAYTSINQMGFLLIGLSLDSVNSIFSSLLFLVVYLIMTVLFFGLLLSLKHFTQNFQVIFLTDLYSLDKNGSVLNFLWIITLFSMAGIPPLAGFFTKYYVLMNAIHHSIYFISLVVLIFSTISSYYYLNFIRYILFEKKDINNLFFYYHRQMKEVILILIIGSLFLTFFMSFAFIFFKKIFTLSLACKYILQ